MLIRHGVKRVRPLEGGLDAWLERGYPVDRVEVENSAAVPKNPLTLT